MFAFSHMFARVYSRFADGRNLANLSFEDSTRELRIELFDGVSGDRYVGRYDESSAESMKNACRSGLSWAAFFELISKAFGEGTLDFITATQQLKVTLKHERQSETIPHPSFTSSIVIELEPFLVDTHANANNDAMRELCDGLLSLAALRGGDSAKEMQRMETVGRESDAAKWYADQLCSEISALESEMQRSERQIAACTARVEELKNLGVEVGDVDAAHLTADVIDRATCRVQDPLEPLGIQCKAYDDVMLRLIKSNFCHHYLIGQDHHLCDTLQPYSADDMKTLEGVQRLLASAPQKRVWEILSSVMHTWHFCTVELQNQCEALVSSPSTKSEHKAGALFYLSYFLLFQTGCIAQLNVSEATLLRFLSAIEASCQPRAAAPFHNALHATDTLQAVGFFIASLNPKRCTLLPSDVLSLVLAATVVCAHHDGLDSNFHIRTKSMLSATFGEQSVIESMHAAFVFELMRLPRYDILEFVVPDQRHRLRCTVGDVIRLTDTAHSDSLLTALRIRLKDDAPLCDDEGRDLARSLILRAAKEAFCARGKESFRSFVTMLRDEHVALGAAEKRADLSPLTPFRGPSVQSPVELAKLILYRINFCGLPVFAALGDIAPHAASFLAGGVVSNSELYHNAEERTALGQTIG
jgi:3',5'-cyclic-nucleotide phosphodiesterase